MESKNQQQKSCSNCKSYYNQIECVGCSNFIKHKYMNDNLNQQGTSQTATHYQQAEVQPIEVMQMYLTHDQFIGFLKGNVIKYTLRAGHKDNEIVDITKARQYAMWLGLVLQGVKIEPMKHILEEKQ